MSRVSRKSPPQQGKGVSIVRGMKKNGPLFLMALPGIVLFLLFRYVPMFGIVLAFQRYNIRAGFFRSEFVGLKNFEYLLGSNIGIILRNTLGYNILFLSVGTVLAIFVAIGITELRNKTLAKFYQAVYIFPHFISWVVVGYLVMGFLHPSRGLVNTRVLEALGLAPVSWYSETKWWPFFILLAYIFKHTGYSSIIYYSTILGINQDLYDAAVIDGAGKMKQIRYITIPSISPMIAALLIIGVGHIFYANFGLFYNVPQNSGALYPVTQVIDIYVYNALMNMGNIGMAAAAGFFQSMVGLILIIITNTAVRKINEQNSLF